jgi:lysophospholipase L1-like esterase
MIDCFIIGDSIAVGVAQQRQQCSAIAQVGISSEQYAAINVTPVSAGRVLISLGSNDGAGSNIEQNLRRIRNNVNSRSVSWLLPANNNAARSAITKIAGEFGDRLIDVRPFAGRDGVHPTMAGYFRISNIWIQQGR